MPQNVQALNTEQVAGGANFPVVWNAMSLDLRPGFWEVYVEASVRTDVGDWVTVGLYNSTVGGGISGTGGASGYAGVGSTGIRNISTMVHLDLKDETTVKPWVIPNGASIITVGIATPNVPCGIMVAKRLVR